MEGRNFPIFSQNYDRPSVLANVISIKSFFPLRIISSPWYANLQRHMRVDRWWPQVNIWESIETNRAVKKCRSMNFLQHYLLLRAINFIPFCEEISIIASGSRRLFWPPACLWSGHPGVLKTPLALSRLLLEWNADDIFCRFAFRFRWAFVESSYEKY